MESQSLLLRFDQVSDVRVPPRALNPMRLDYGGEQHLGRTVKLPAERREQYPAFVSDIDETLNELSGIRLPDVSVPVTTNTGWNPRHSSIGNEDLLIGITGGLAGWTLPLPNTEEEKKLTGDPRPSIESLYVSKENYLSQVKQAAEQLADERYILGEDVEEIIEKAELRYEDISNS